MATTTTFKRPRTCACGRTFEASPADTTVRCPICRKVRRAIKTSKRVARTVEAAGRTCTVRGPITAGGHPCGAPAVTAFTGATGTVFAECAEHAR